MVLTQPSNITLTSEQMLKVDGTIKKAIVIDAFINPDNLWDTKYSALDAGAESIDEMKAFVL